GGSLKDPQNKAKPCILTGKSNKTRRPKISRQKRSVGGKVSKKKETINLKSEYTSEWIRNNEDFFSTFSLDYEPAYVSIRSSRICANLLILIARQSCELIRSTDDLFSETQSSKHCNLNSSFMVSLSTIVTKTLWSPPSKKFS
ncbi:hypothetical protein ANCCAN_23250, partial [Ancylostoma caninum]